MITVRMKKGLDLRITGRPEPRVERLTGVDRVGLSPVAIPHIKPRLLVRVDDRVKRGTPLFTDKRNPDIRFVSPGGGVVETIDFGPRRVIRAIIIRLDREEAGEKFEIVKPARLAAMTRPGLARHLMKGGLWPLIRSLPFRNIADPETTPPAIVINLDTLDPFHPEPALYLKNASPDFLFGLEALKRMAPEVHLVVCHDKNGLPPEVARQVTHQVRGSYPADDPGVFVYYTRTSVADNHCWYIHGSHVPLLGRFLSEGEYPVERLVAVSTTGGGRLVATRQGVSLSLLTPELRASDDLRAIVGGVWRGRAVENDACLGFYDTALTLLPAGNRPEFLGFLRPGWRKPSRSRAFLSRLNPKPLPLDSGQHGEERACVNCGSCAEVCPVEILPQFTVKCLLAGEIEEALAHGLLDCVECGLCAYVCPSKVELVRILSRARKDCYRERVSLPSSETHPESGDDKTEPVKTRT